MLREVRKNFDGENNVPLKPGDIVDVSEWKHVKAMEEQGMLGITEATKATVDFTKEKKSIDTSPAHKMPVKLKRSALASRPRVFLRKA